MLRLHAHAQIRLEADFELRRCGIWLCLRGHGTTFIHAIDIFTDTGRHERGYLSCRREKTPMRPWCSTYVGRRDGRSSLNVAFFVHR